MQNQYFKVFLVTFIQFFLVTIRCCPYSSFNEAILPASYPQDIQLIQPQIYSQTEGNSFSISFWTFSIPFFTPNKYPKVGEDFKEGIQEEGQFIMMINCNQDQKILNYVNFDFDNQLIFHNFVFLNTGQEIVQFPFISQNYEGIWYFTLITFNFGEGIILIQISQNILQTITAPNIEFNQIILGGRGYIEGYNLNLFRGRMSKIYVSQMQEFEGFQFENFYNLCKIPNEFEGEQEIILANGLTNFDGSNSISVSFKHAGNVFFVCGWVKYDISKISNYATIPLIRISLFQNYNFFQKEGDEIFYMEAFIAKDIPSDTNIYFSKDMHENPIYGPDNFWWGYEWLYDSDDKYLDALQKWHFVKMEYIQLQYEGFTQLSILFQNELGYQLRQLLGKQIINTYYYVFIGKDEFSSDYLQADLFDFKIYYYYQYNMKFYIYDACHYSCQTCNGPLFNNCKKCGKDSNRLFLEELQECQCIDGFIDVGVSQCKEFFQLFQSVQFKEIQDILYEYCDLGYFQFSTDNNNFICIQCPQQTDHSVLCAECISNPFTWYQNPICLSDFIQFDGYLDGAYIQKFRKDIDIDLYFIDLQGQLTLHQQYFNFCDPEIDNQNCYLSNFQHLGQQTYIKCKPNYFYSQGQCQYSNPFCLEVNVQGVCQTKIEGMYELNGQYYQCPINCLQCQYNLQQNQIECKNCIQGYGLLNDKCIQCGIFCKTCQNYFDPNLQSSYLKCYKCIDDSLYFFSFDAINCQENKITHCQYAFQAVKDDLQFNTLDLYFFPRNDSENLQTYCARCDYNYIFVFSSFQCLLGNNSDCDFGYAEQINDISQNPGLQQLLLLDKYLNYNGIEMYLAFESNGDVTSTSQQICIIQEIQYDQTVQFSKDCVIADNNCKVCIIGQKFLDYFINICQDCKLGYYLDRITSKCEICPAEMNCYQCYQQQILSQDYWKKDIRAFYKVFIEGINQIHPFVDYGQSQKYYEYQILCSTCQKEYVLFKNKCIFQCTDSCQDCLIIDNQSLCAKCPQIVKGRMLTTINNECTQCPENCALCRQRSSSQISLINPLFSNTEFTIYTYQCLKSFDDQNYYYDNFLGRFLDCKFEEKCQHSFVIELNLYCQSEEYYIDLQNSKVKNEENKFVKSNILFENLISGHSFSEFENKEFFYYANQKAIKTIIVQISSNNQQDCSVNTDGVISQSFGQNIFTTINVEIKFSFKFQMKMYIKKSLQFQNFNRISLNNLSIISIQNNRFKQIILTSIYPQEIYFYQMTYQQQIFTNDSSQFIFNNVQKLIFDDLIIQNLMQNNASNLFQIQGSEQKYIQIKNLLILNSIIKNQIFLSFEKIKDETIIFENWKINAEFENFTIINADQSNSFGKIIINQIELLGRVNENQIFNHNFVIKNSIIFNIQGYNTLVVNNIHVEESEFINSSLLCLSDNSVFSQIVIENSKFVNSMIVFNSNKTIYETTFLNYEFANIKFQNNQYDETSKFFNLKRFTSQIQNLFAQVLIISGNQLHNISESFNPKSVQSALVYLELDYIEFQSISINRSYGLVEISIYDPKRLTMQSISITQNNQSKTLYQSLSCLISHLIEQIEQPSLKIFSALEVIIQDLLIIQTSVFNNPIIYYESADITSKVQFEKITIMNAIVSGNVLLQTKSNVNFALFYLFSNQQTNIIFSNITFNNNILNAYTQDYQEMSALLLNIDAIQGSMVLRNSFFRQNVIFNTSNSILYIKLSKFQLLNCIFDENNIFKYENIQNQLMWGFFNQDSKEILSDDISQIFQIKSNSGNGVLIAKELYISNIVLSNSQGSFGGAFQIYSLLNAIIQVKNLVISNTSTLFQEENEAGGAIFIDGTLCQSIEIEVLNVVASNITSRYNGGLLYIQSGTDKVTINVSNVKVQNSFALIGSVFFLTLSNVATDNQYLCFRNISIQNSEEQFISFYSKLSQQQLSQNETNILLNNRTLIYIFGGNQLILQNIDINSIILEAAITIVKSVNISIFDFYLFNCSINWGQILIQSDKNLDNSIFLKNIQIQNVTQSYNQTSLVCNSNTILKKIISLICPQGVYDAPKNLKPSYQNLSTGNCFLQQTINSITTNFLSIIYISELTDVQKLKLIAMSFTNILCNSCQYGILGLIYSSNTIKNNYSLVENLSIKNSQCGQKGCLVILTDQSQSAVNLNRILSNDQLYQSNKHFIIKHYICLNNTSINGPCIYIKNVQLLLQQCAFLNNTAQVNGGSIYVEGTQELILQQCIIEGNNALIGGGLMLQNQQELIYKSLNTLIIQNIASIFSNDTVSWPSQLSIIFGKKDQILQTKTIFENKIQKIEIITEILYLPTGQKLSEYQIFNLQTRTYNSFNQQFRIVALNNRNNIMKNLENTFCSIQSRIYNSSNLIDDSLFLTNFTSIQFINFNLITKDYNLDDLIIYFDNNSPKELFLQLQFMCNSIQIPQYSKQYPYNIITSHQNYQLRINIRSFPCQYGEIKNTTDHSCTKCDGGEDYFSLVLNAEKCQLKDDVSTISVNSVKLNLRPYYWRPYFHATIVSYCSNLPTNCLGGWTEGDDSCYIGHIGALCQSCDIYNIRGQGYYSVSDKYKCSPCSDKQMNIIILIIVSLWMFLSTFISVQSTNQTIQQNIRFLNIFNFNSQYKRTKQSAKLLKLFTNYLQIIGSLSSLQLQIPQGLQLFIFSLSSPTKQTVYSIDCFLKDFMNIQIQYARMIWQILTFGIYVNGFFICYIFFTIFKGQKLNSSVISTSLIYIYIYIQPGLIAGLIELVSSSTISGYKWILANVAFRYDTDYHFKWMLEFCLPLIILLAIIIPLFLFLCLYSNREILEKKNVQSKYGYLFLEYKRTSYYWEIVKIVEKELIILFLTYYEDNVIAKAILTQIILILYLELNQISKPFTTLQLNQIDYFSAQVCLISLALSIGIYITNEQNYPEIQIPFSVILILLNAFLIMKFIINFFVEFFNEQLGFLSAKLDFIRDYFRKQFPFLNKITFLQNLLENKTEKKARIDQLFKKLKIYLRNQARDIMIIKKLVQLPSFQTLQQSKINQDLDQRFDSIPQSLRSLASQDNNLLSIHQAIKKGQREYQINKGSRKTSIFKVNTLKFKNLEQNSNAIEN